MIKYIFSLILTLATFKITRSLNYILVGAVELLLIAALTNMIVRYRKKLAYIFNSIFILLYNIQMLVLFFGGSYIQSVMISNLGLLEDLSGKIVEYGIGAILILVCSFLPVKKVNICKVSISEKIVIIAAICVEFCMVGLCGRSASPFLEYGNLFIQEYKMSQMRHLTNNESAENEFFTAVIEDNWKKDEKLVDKPNVILIFTEGLSQNIIDDDRNIMPNFADLQKRSLSFIGYYNHTFATFRGIIGQLYSGYQLDNEDKNILVSIQSILKNQGYSTSFINTEPENETFTNYLKWFGFDQIVGNIQDEREGNAHSYSDKQAFEMLFQTAMAESQDFEPFFTVIYTFGTHVSFDSINEKYGDGKNSLLNRFYDYDRQLGSFLNKFNESEIAENTIIVITADHATFADSDFLSTFPNYEREHSMVDEIPLCIYYKGIEPSKYNVRGRNSLALAPTILDYLDISEENYFLGKSLFGEKESGKLSLDTIFNEETILLNTDGGRIASLSSEQTVAMEEILQKYFATKIQTTSEELSGRMGELFNNNLTWKLSEDGRKLILSYRPRENENNTTYWFPVWSAEDGQDDLVWYEGKLEEDGCWRVDVDLDKHLKSGTINIHLYGDDRRPEKVLTKISIIIED